MKNLYAIAFSILISFVGFSQNNDCGEEDNVCTEPNFDITSDTSTDDVVDFGSGTGSNPSTNPNGSNSGCLLSGETSSTFMLVNVVSAGVLEWSIGTDGGTGCYDWIMWPFLGDGTTCQQLQDGTLPPVACNWNGNCEGFTGMASGGSMPAGGDASNFEAGINAMPGDQFLICFSNYSFQDLSVSISFFGTADVSCEGFTPDQSICQGETADVNISFSGFMNPTYSWNTTNGVIGDPSAGPDFQLNPSVTTDYEVTLTENGFSEVIPFTITVATPPAPDAGLDQDGCFGSPVALTGAISDPANAFSWSFNAPSGLPAAGNILFTPSAVTLTPTVQANYAGTYDLILSEDNGVCPVESDTAVITFHQVFQDVTFTNPLCRDSCNGSITITSVEGIEFSIDGGTNWFPSNIFNDLCDGNYTVMSKDGYGCTVTENIVLIDPSEVLITVSNDTTVCINGSVSLLATGSNGTTFSYHWGHTGDLSALQVEMPNAATLYTVYAENEFGCLSQEADIDVDLYQPLTATITINDTICPNDASTITVSVIGGEGAPYSYNWYTPAGSNPAGTNSLTVTPSSTTNYYVEVTDGCETPADTVLSSIVMSPVPVVTFTADTTQACEPGEFRLWNTTDPSLSDGLRWEISDGTTLNNLPLIDIQITDPGLYDVKLVVTTDQGCTDSLTKTSYLQVHPNPIAEFISSPTNPTMFNPIAQMNNISIGGYTYDWDFGVLATPTTSTDFEPSVTYPDATVGTYPVELIVTSEHNCRDTARLDISVIPELLLYVPNAFTPDADEYNPTWGVVIDGIDVDGFDLIVFNRWGEIVWQANDPNEFWDGKYKGKLVETGTYVWTLSAKDIINDKKYTFNGHLNVLY